MLNLQRVYNIQRQDECGEILYVRCKLLATLTTSTDRYRNRRLL